MNTITDLNNRAILRLSGNDVQDFLQNIITCDVENLRDDELTFGALLSPQGKILFDFFVVKQTSGFLLDVHKDHAADLFKRLTFYKLRADVTIEIADDLTVVAAWGTQKTSNNGSADPRIGELGYRTYLTQPSGSDNVEAYNAHCISSGVPQSVFDFELGNAFPHDVLMDQFEGTGIDFSKGCYVGQEVVSRMQHRGTARNRFVQVTGTNELPALGTELLVGDRAIGKMGGHSGSLGLALVRTDRASKAIQDDLPIKTGGQTVTLKLPHFVNFDFNHD